MTQDLNEMINEFTLVELQKKLGELTEALIYVDGKSIGGKFTKSDKIQAATILFYMLKRDLLFDIAEEDNEKKVTKKVQAFLNSYLESMDLLGLDLKPFVHKNM